MKIKSLRSGIVIFQSPFWRHSPTLMTVKRQMNKILQPTKIYENNLLNYFNIKKKIIRYIHRILETI